MKNARSAASASSSPLAGSHPALMAAMLLLGLSGSGAARAASELLLENREVRLWIPAACPEPGTATRLPSPPAADAAMILPGRILVALRDYPARGALITGRDSDGCAMTGVATLDRSSHILGIRSVEAVFGTEREGPLGAIVRLEIDDRVDPREAAALVAEGEDVRWAEPDHLRLADLVPSDASWVLQWNMQQVDAPRAWDLQTGDPGAIIAVIDTGVQISHPELHDRIWVNQAENFAIPKFDDDHNGYVDDFQGWDFVDVAPFAVALGEDPGPPDNQPLDRQGHGTSVAGVIAAEANNMTPFTSNVAGACWGCRIMALRAGYMEAGSGFGVIPASLSAAAIVYAADNGAGVINMSYSGPVSAQIEEEALAYAIARGLFPVASAGNIGDPNQADQPVYPAATPGVFAVAATDKFDSKAIFSKYGTYVDLSAPGLQIFTTGLTTGVAPILFRDGTSFSAPLVAGVAGLLISERPGLEGSDLEGLLKASAVDIESRNIPFQGLMGEGRLDAFGALAAHRLAITNAIDDPNTPSAAYNVTGVTLDANAPWLDFPLSAPLAIGPGETAWIDAAVDETLADCGWNRAEVTIMTDDPAAGSFDVPVVLRLDCDGDNDGYICEDRGGQDCDDIQPLVSPGAEERCNGSLVCLGLPGMDENCDGAIDDICSCSGRPNPVEIVRVSVIPGTGVRLEWRDLSNNEIGFKIQRRSRPKGKWKVLAKLVPDSRVFIDTAADGPARFQYGIKAYKKGGKGTRVLSGEHFVP
jgi:subtilisin family serine protease